jgi:hypothetical protein
VRLPLVTRRQASSVIRGNLGSTFEVALVGHPLASGHRFRHSKRARLLVPHFGEGTVEAFELE